MIKTCSYAKCGKEFETDKATQVYCSGACIAKEKRDKATAKNKEKKKGRAPKSAIPKEEKLPVMEEEKMPDRLPDGVMINAPEVLPPVFELPTVAVKELSPEEEKKLIEEFQNAPIQFYHKPPEPWIAEISAYCESVNIFPQDLIEFHRNANKPKSNKTPVLNYFEQRQKRMRGEE